MQRMAATVQLRVFLAGRVAVETDGVVLEEARFAGRQGRLVFAYLVASRDRPVPTRRARGRDLGGIPPATWEKALTVIASKLRGVRSQGGPRRDRADEHVRLLPARAAGRILGRPDCSREAADGAEERSPRAISTAQGRRRPGCSLAREPFLPGEDGAWVEQKRRDLADIRERALTVLATVPPSRGRREAARWAEQADRLSSRFARAGTAVSWRPARRGKSRRGASVYERCRQLLAEELGTYPSPETDSIYRALLEAPQASVRTTPVAEPTVDPVSPSSREPRRRLYRSGRSR